MKKILSVILALTLVLSMSVTAFAKNEGSTTVSVVVPSYDYTVNIPKSCQIEYGNTEPQHIGTVTVTSKNWDTILADYLGVSVECCGGEYMSNKNGDVQINCLIGTVDSLSEFFPFPSSQTTWGFKADGAEPSNLSKLYIRVHNWSNAQPGESYSVTITYTSWLAEKS